MSRTTITDDVDVSTLRPIGDYVLAEILRREQTGGGIYLPKNPATAAVFARVVRVGSGILDGKTGAVYPIGLEPGDIILFMDYGGERLELRDGKYRLIRSHGIWARLELENAETYELKSIHPRGEFVVVKPEDETYTPSGHLLMPNAKDARAAARAARVVCVGPGRWDSETGERDPIPLSPGERVVMTRYAGEDIYVGGKWLRIVQECDIWCGLSEKSK